MQERRFWPRDHLPVHSSLSLATATAALLPVRTERYSCGRLALPASGRRPHMRGRQRQPHTAFFRFLPCDPLPCARGGARTSSREALSGERVAKV